MIVTVVAAMKDMVHAMADVAPGGGHSVAGSATNVSGRVACSPTRLGDVMTDPATGVLGGVHRISQRDAEGGQ